MPFFRIFTNLILVAMIFYQSACGKGEGNGNPQTSPPGGPPAGPPTTSPFTPPAIVLGELDKLPVVKIALKGTAEFCSGTMVADDLVLTAAHCFYDEKGKKLKHPPVSVRLKLTDQTLSPPYEVDSYKTSDFGNPYEVKDIAAIKLKQKVLNLTPIKIALRATNTDELEAGTQTYAFGFRSLKWSVRKIAPLETDPKNFSHAWEIPLFKAWGIPTEYEPRMTGGDSGGPLLIKQDGELLLLGVLQGEVHLSKNQDDTSFTAVQPFLADAENLLGRNLETVVLK